MERIEKKSDGRANNGGARRGAGRPKTKDRVLLFLPMELAERIKAHPDRNQLAETLFKKHFGSN